MTDLRVRKEATTAMAMVLVLRAAFEKTTMTMIHSTLATFAALVALGLLMLWDDCRA